LSAARRAQEEVRTALAARRDPLVELAEVDAGGADVDSVAAAKALGPVIVAVARGDVRSVADRLDQLGAAGEIPIGPLRQWTEAGGENGDRAASTTRSAGSSFRRRTLSAEHCDLMTQDQEFDVLGAVVAGELVQYLQRLAQKQVYQ
jgi:hypothetical protein